MSPLVVLTIFFGFYPATDPRCERGLGRSADQELSHRTCRGRAGARRAAAIGEDSVTSLALVGRAARADLGDRRHGTAARGRLHPQGAGRTHPVGRGPLPRARRILRVAGERHDHPVRRQLHRRSLRPCPEAADAHRVRRHADHVASIIGGGKGASKFEFPILVLLATTGMLMMISANDLIALYVGLELQSLALYVVAAFDRALGAIERGRDQIFRPRRALLRHAALWRLADLRLHRLDPVHRHRRRACSLQAPISASSSAWSS